MNITLSINQDISPEVVDLVLGGKLEGGYSIDYAINALTSFYQGREIIIFDFKPYVILDNRLVKSHYEIEQTVSQLIIKFR